MKVNWREPGLPASVVLHGALLVAALVSFAAPKPFADAQEAIAVEVIDESAIRQVMRGDPRARPQPTPSPRVDRVAEQRQQNPSGQAARQVDALEAPARQEATAPEERKEQAAVVVPPPLTPRVVPPPPPRPVEPPRAATPPPAPAQKTEEQEEAEEAIRQAQRKREEQRKADEQRRVDEARRTEERRKAEEQRKADEQKRSEEAQARQEQQRAEQQRREREQLEARLREDQKKAADAKAAEDRKKAEDAKKAQEAAKKAAEERRRREAEQEARNQAATEAARRALLASREAPQNSGNTGQQVSQPSQGAPTATGQRLNPSDRAALVGLLADQIRACWNVPVSGRPSVLPQVRMVLNQDGSLGASPVLVNSSGDPTFRAVAESGMRAIRQCSPFRIPARFQPTFNDWRSTIVQLNPDD